MVLIKHSCGKKTQIHTIPFNQCSSVATQYNMLFLPSANDFHTMRRSGNYSFKSTSLIKTVWQFHLSRLHELKPFWVNAFYLVARMRGKRPIGRAKGRRLNPEGGQSHPTHQTELSVFNLICHFYVWALISFTAAGRRPQASRPKSHNWLLIHPIIAKSWGVFR